MSRTFEPFSQKDFLNALPTAALPANYVLQPNTPSGAQGATGVSGQNALTLDHSGNLNFSGTGTRNINNVNTVTLTALHFPSPNLVDQTVPYVAQLYTFPSGATVQSIYQWMLGSPILVQGGEGFELHIKKGPYDLTAGWWCYIRNAILDTTNVIVYLGGGYSAPLSVPLYGRASANSVAPFQILTWDGSVFVII